MLWEICILNNDCICFLLQKPPFCMTSLGPTNAKALFQTSRYFSRHFLLYLYKHNLRRMWWLTQSPVNIKIIVTQFIVNLVRLKIRHHFSEPTTWNPYLRRLIAPTVLRPSLPSCRTILPTAMKFHPQSGQSWCYPETNDFQGAYHVEWYSLFNYL